MLHVCQCQLQVYGQQCIVRVFCKNLGRSVSEKTCLRHDGCCIGAEKETRQGQEKDVKTAMILTVPFVQKVKTSPYL